MQFQDIQDTVLQETVMTAQMEQTDNTECSATQTKKRAYSEESQSSSKPKLDKDDSNNFEVKIVKYDIRNDLVIPRRKRSYKPLKHSVINLSDQAKLESNQRSSRMQIREISNEMFIQQQLDPQFTQEDHDRDLKQFGYKTLKMNQLELLNTQKNMKTSEYKKFRRANNKQAKTYFNNSSQVFNSNRGYNKFTDKIYSPNRQPELNFEQVDQTFYRLDNLERSNYMEKSPQRPQKIMMESQQFRHNYGRNNMAHQSLSQAFHITSVKNLNSLTSNSMDFAYLTSFQLLNEQMRTPQGLPSALDVSNPDQSLEKSQFYRTSKKGEPSQKGGESNLIDGLNIFETKGVSSMIKQQPISARIKVNQRQHQNLSIQEYIKASIQKYRETDTAFNSLEIDMQSKRSKVETQCRDEMRETLKANYNFKDMIIKNNNVAQDNRNHLKEGQEVSGLQRDLSRLSTGMLRPSKIQYKRRVELNNTTLCKPIFKVLYNPDTNEADLSSPQFRRERRKTFVEVRKNEIPNNDKGQDFINQSGLKEQKRYIQNDENLVKEQLITFQKDQQSLQKSPSQQDTLEIQNLSKQSSQRINEQNKKQARKSLFNLSLQHDMTVKTLKLDPQNQNAENSRSISKLEKQHEIEPKPSFINIDLLPLQDNKLTLMPQKPKAKEPTAFVIPVEITHPKNKNLPPDSPSCHPPLAQPSPTNANPSPIQNKTPQKDVFIPQQTVSSHYFLPTQNPPQNKTSQQPGSPHLQPQFPNLPQSEHPTPLSLPKQIEPFLPFKESKRPKAQKLRVQNYRQAHQQKTQKAKSSRFSPNKMRQEFMHQHHAPSERLQSLLMVTSATNPTGMGGRDTTTKQEESWKEMGYHGGIDGIVTHGNSHQTQQNRLLSYNRQQDSVMMVLVTTAKPTSHSKQASQDLGRDGNRQEIGSIACINNGKEDEDGRKKQHTDSIKFQDVDEGGNRLHTRHAPTDNINQNSEVFVLHDEEMPGIINQVNQASSLTLQEELKANTKENQGTQCIIKSGDSDQNSAYAEIITFKRKLSEIRSGVTSNDRQKIKRKVEYFKGPNMEILQPKIHQQTFQEKKMLKIQELKFPEQSPDKKTNLGIQNQESSGTLYIPINKLQPVVMSLKKTSQNKSSRVKISPQKLTQSTTVIPEGLIAGKSLQNLNNEIQQNTIGHQQLQTHWNVNEEFNQSRQVRMMFKTQQEFGTQVQRENFNMTYQQLNINHTDGKLQSVQDRPLINFQGEQGHNLTHSSFMDDQMTQNQSEQISNSRSLCKSKVEADGEQKSKEEQKKESLNSSIKIKVSALVQQQLSCSSMQTSQVTSQKQQKSVQQCVSQNIQPVQSKMRGELNQLVEIQPLLKLKRLVQSFRSKANTADSAGQVDKKLDKGVEVKQPLLRANQDIEDELSSQSSSQAECGAVQEPSCQKRDNVIIGGQGLSQCQDCDPSCRCDDKQKIEKKQIRVFDCQLYNGQVQNTQEIKESQNEIQGGEPEKETSFDAKTQPLQITNKPYENEDKSEIQQKEQQTSFEQQIQKSLFGISGSIKSCSQTPDHELNQSFFLFRDQESWNIDQSFDKTLGFGKTKNHQQGLPQINKNEMVLPTKTSNKLARDQTYQLLDILVNKPPRKGVIRQFQTQQSGQTELCDIGLPLLKKHEAWNWIRHPTSNRQSSQNANLIPQSDRYSFDISARQFLSPDPTQSVNQFTKHHLGAHPLRNSSQIEQQSRKQLNIPYQRFPNNYSLNLIQSPKFSSYNSTEYMLNQNQRYGAKHLIKLE